MSLLSALVAGRIGQPYSWGGGDEDARPFAVADAAGPGASEARAEQASASARNERLRGERLTFSRLGQRAARTRRSGRSDRTRQARRRIRMRTLGGPGPALQHAVGHALDLRDRGQALADLVQPVPAQAPHAF